MHRLSHAAIETEGPPNTFVHAHTFRFITPQMTDKYKIPNPCTSAITINPLLGQPTPCAIGRNARRGGCNKR